MTLLRWSVEPDRRRFQARVRPLLESRIDYNLLATVLAGLHDDAGSPPPRFAVAVDEHDIVLWCAAGHPVSMVAANPPVAGVVRVGPVYTPPEHRRRGHASSAVAAVSRAVLAAGAHTCTLFTDLANPTSNRIYAAIGYRRFADWEQYDFQPSDRRRPHRTGTLPMHASTHPRRPDVGRDRGGDAA